jgi:hypothetical protein
MELEVQNRGTMETDKHLVHILNDFVDIPELHEPQVFQQLSATFHNFTIFAVYAV